MSCCKLVKFSTCKCLDDVWLQQLLIYWLQDDYLFSGSADNIDEAPLLWWCDGMSLPVFLFSFYHLYTWARNVPSWRVSLKSELTQWRTGDVWDCGFPSTSKFGGFWLLLWGLDMVVATALASTRFIMYVRCM